MRFSFTAEPGFDFLTNFAAHIQGEVNNDLMLIPEHLGEGYIRKLTFGPEFKITIHHYVLKEDLIISRNSAKNGIDLITIFYYNNEQPLEIAFENQPQVWFSQRDESAVQVTSNDLSSSIRFPAQHKIHYVVVAITPAYLRSQLALSHPNSVLQTMTKGGNSFLYFEGMSSETRRLLAHMADANGKDPLNYFFMQIKVQELLYILLQRLSVRESAPHQSLNSADAERLLHIRSKVIRDLSSPPVLKDLANIAAMSETKLKQLFKQTFGNSIYSYFQQARMEEAALLLKQGKHSVAEVGYQLGFSNLSHFSRLFEKHYGQNPKKFSRS